MLQELVTALTVLPLAGAVFAAFAILAVLFSGRLSRVLKCSAWLVALFFAAGGLVVAFTLTPQVMRGSLLGGSILASENGGYTLRAPWDWWEATDRQLNIVLFVPIGLAVGLVNRDGQFRHWPVYALSSPIVVEGLQATVPALHRDGSWADVFDNVVGVLIGLTLASLLNRVWRHYVGGSRTA